MLFYSRHNIDATYWKHNIKLKLGKNGCFFETYPQRKVGPKILRLCYIWSSTIYKAYMSVYILISIVQSQSGSELVVIQIKPTFFVLIN